MRSHDDPTAGPGPPEAQDGTFKTLFDANPQAMWVCDAETLAFLAVNDAALRLLGYSGEEFLALTPRDLCLPDEAASGPGKPSEPVPVGRDGVTAGYRSRAGRPIVADTRSAAVTWRGRPARVVVAVDITDRIAAEHRLSQAIRVAHIGPWEYDVAAGEFLFSDDYYALHGTSVEDVGGYRMTAERFAREFVHPDDAHRVGESIAAAVASTDAHFEHRSAGRIRRGDGSWQWVDVWFRVERDATGRVVRLIGVNQDVTERRRAEEDRERLQAQLLQAQKMESVGRLAGGVAHDFNNMLQAMLGNVELALEDAGEDGHLRDHLIEVQRVAHRSADLTRQLLAFARRQTVNPRVVDFNATVAGTLKMLRRLIGEDIDLSWEPALAVWPVRVDPSQVDQILANLVVNARDAIAGVGRITLSTANATLDEAYCASRPWARPGEYVRLAVADTGGGMGPDVLAHLFEPFFTTKDLGKGTGLGLATVYGIVKQNDGIIDVASEIARGTTISVYLPRCADPVPTVSAGASATVRGGHETVLVVEDEHSILSLLRTVLSRQGYHVLTVRTPNDALERARTHAGAVDLLITDVVMPQMNGRELAERLRARWPRLKALFMSGYSVDIIAHGGAVDQGVQFIAKPFSASALADKVRETLER